jgi:hypothetical protein
MKYLLAHAFAITQLPALLPIIAVIPTQEGSAGIIAVIPKKEGSAAHHCCHPDEGGICC